VTRLYPHGPSGCSWLISLLPSYLLTFSFFFPSLFIPLFTGIFDTSLSATNPILKWEAIKISTRSTTSTTLISPLIHSSTSFPLHPKPWVSQTARASPGIQNLVDQISLPLSLMAAHQEEARSMVQTAIFLSSIMSLVFSGMSSLPSLLKLINSNASLNKAQEEGRKFWLTSCCHVLCSKHDRKLSAP